MELVKVGPDEIEISDFPQGFDIFIYDYRDEGYSGDGEAVGYKDGVVYWYYLGHDSYCGPIHHSMTADKKIPLKDFISGDIHHGIENPDIEIQMFIWLNNHPEEKAKHA